jgi:hypothetical protein
VAPPKKRTPAQVRDRRAKIAAVVLGVVFLGVGAIQGPKLLKQLHPSVPAAEDSAPPPSSLGGSASLAAVTLAPGPLRRFTTFAIRDPFKAQVSANANAGGGGSGATGASGAAKKAAGATGATGPAATFTETATGGGATPVRTVPAALILYNGKRQLVPLGMGFPKKKPMFRLVSLGLKNVRIGLIGGSFANGKTTLALAQNRKVTLADSTNGGKFVLRLLRLTTAPAPVATPAKSSSKKPAATTPPGTTTTGG